MDSGSDDGKGLGTKVGPVEGEDTPPPIHPHAGDPLLVEDPGIMMCCVCVTLTALRTAPPLTSYTITISSVSPFSPRIASHRIVPHRMDAVNVMNNVTKNCYKAPAVQKAFFEVRHNRPHPMPSRSFHHTP